MFQSSLSYMIPWGWRVGSAVKNTCWSCQRTWVQFPTPICNSNFRGANAFWPLWTPDKHVVHIHTCKQNTKQSKTDSWLPNCEAPRLRGSEALGWTTVSHPGVCALLALEWTFEWTCNYKVWPLSIHSLLLPAALAGQISLQRAKPRIHPLYHHPRLQVVTV